MGAGKGGHYSLGGGGLTGDLGLDYMDVILHTVVDK